MGRLATLKNKGVVRKNRREFIMKKALLGVANNLRSNLQKVTLWSNSFKNVTDGEVILLLANGTEDDLLICKDLGITSHLVTSEDAGFFNHKRLELHHLNFLKT